MICGVPIELIMTAVVCAIRPAHRSLRTGVVASKQHSERALFADSAQFLFSARSHNGRRFPSASQDGARVRERRRRVPRIPISRPRSKPISGTARTCTSTHPDRSTITTRASDPSTSSAPRLSRASISSL
jgi:hypothetical protein